MKKFNDWVSTVQEAELSDLQKSYRDYFTAKLKKYGAESPADLDEEKKKEFFNEITADWEKGKGVKPAAKDKVEKEKEEAGIKEGEEVNEAEVKSDAEFMEYANTVLKKAFGDKFDEEKAKKTAEGILKKADGDYGAAIGMLTSGLGG
jgi:hypothetical protein